MRSQRQVDQGGRRRLELLFAVEPGRARGAYRERLEEAGIPGAVAAEVAGRVGEDPESLRRLLLGGEKATRAELRAGLLTGLAYLAGALVPVLPYLLAGSAWTALVLSVLGAGAALAAVGGVVAALSGLTVGVKVREMLLAGLGAAALAYLFGALLGAFLGVTPA